MTWNFMNSMIPLVGLEFHDPRQCSECLRRWKMIKSKVFPMEDIAVYRPENDPQYQNIIQEEKEMETVLSNDRDKFYCKTCDVRCFSEDFFKTHISGSKHRKNTSGGVTTTRTTTTKRKTTGGPPNAQSSSSSSSSPPPPTIYKPTWQRSLFYVNVSKYSP